MGFKDSLMKVIGMEEIEDDEIVTEQELEEAKRKIVRETEKETKIICNAVARVNKTLYCRKGKPNSYTAGHCMKNTIPSSW